MRKHNKAYRAKGYLKYDLQFFASKEGPGGEKTEKPTAKRREKAREEGQVAKSMEINTAFLLIFMFIGIKLFASYMYDRFLKLFQDVYILFPQVDEIFTSSYMIEFLPNMFQNIILITAPLLVIAVIVGIGVNYFQVGWHPTTKPLKPKFSRLNPLQGFKKIISARSLVELLKSLGKVAIIGLIIYNSISKEKEGIFLVLDMPIIQIVSYIGNIAINTALKVGMFFIIIAIADYSYQRYDFETSIKMTKQEIKDEYKMQEGNPEIKSKIRQKMREISMRRMIQEIPKADVIITNPTHFAVALRYDSQGGSAPIVIAKGTDYLAARIKKIASENEIEIVENKPLARSLYYTVDIGEEIPPELYQAVAEILAFVYSLKQNRS